MSKPPPQIYIFVSGQSGTDVIGTALAEDGEVLAGHVSSDVTFLHHDMGLTSDWKHTAYQAHYPDGYEVVWVGDPDTHAGFWAAYDRHRAKYGDATPPMEGK